MARLRSLLIVFLVLSTASAFTLACAFVCADRAEAAAAVTASHCHQKLTFPPGDGYRPAHVVCPVMQSLEGSELRALPSVAKAPASKVAYLPFESLLLAKLYLPSEYFPGPAVGEPPPRPPFSRNLVLRL